MRFISLRLIFLFWVSFATAQNINLDTQIKGSKWPASGTDTGAANAYAVSGLTLGPALRPFSKIDFIAAHTNTGISTLAINGGTAISLVKPPNIALSAGDITVGNLVEVVYDGTRFQCITCGASSGGGSNFNNNSVSLFDEFIAATTAQNLGWISNGGGGAIVIQPTSSSAANNPGIVEVNGAASSTTWEYYILGASNTGQDYLNPQTGTFKWYWRVNDQGGPANGILRIGMVDDRGNQTPTSGVYFEATTALGSSNWWCIQKSGGTASTADSGVSAAAGTYHTLEADFSASPTIIWKIDGASVCGAIAATNVPNLNLTVAAEASATSSKVWLDFFRLDITTTGR